MELLIAWGQIIILLGASALASEQNCLPSSLKTTIIRPPTAEKQMLSQMRECLAKQPVKKPVLNRSALRQAVIETIAGETILISTAVLAQGRDGVHMKDLGASMAAEAVSSSAGTLLANGSGSMKARYLRSLAYGQALNVGQLGFYELLPTKKGEEKPNAKKYAVMNAGYSVVDGVIWIGMNEFVAGLECLYPGQNKTLIMNGGIRLLYSGVANYAYFMLDKKMMYSQPKKPDGPGK